MWQFADVFETVNEIEIRALDLSTMPLYLSTMYLLYSVTMPL